MKKILLLLFCISFNLEANDWREHLLEIELNSGQEKEIVYQGLKKSNKNGKFVL